MMDEPKAFNHINTISFQNIKKGFIQFVDIRVCLALLVVIVPLTYQQVWAVPGTQCFEQIQCATQALINQPWTTSKQYFDAFIPSIGGVSLTLTIFWGCLIAVIWIRSQSPMLVMIVGIIVSTTAIGLNQLAVGIGLMLCSVALGIVLYQIIRQRTSVLSF